MRRDIDKRLRKLEATMRPDAAHSVYMHIGDYYAASRPLAPSPSPGWAVATIARPTPELAALLAGVNPFFWIDWDDDSPGAESPPPPPGALGPDLDLDAFRAAVLASTVDGTQRMVLAGATKWVVASMVGSGAPAEEIAEEEEDIEPEGSNDHGDN